jgi:hypothetical protein
MITRKNKLNGKNKLETKKEKKLALDYINVLLRTASINECMLDIDRFDQLIIQPRKDEDGDRLECLVPNVSRSLICTTKNEVSTRKSVGFRTGET